MTVTELYIRLSIVSVFRTCTYSSCRPLHVYIHTLPSTDHVDQLLVFVACHVYMTIYLE